MWAAAAPLLGLVARAQPAKQLKIVVTGGHPGDPECGCAGTIARYADLGHDVVLLYLNRGEGFCNGADPSQCGAVRSAEALKACQILHARAAFLTQTDGKAVVDNAHSDAVRRTLDAERPDAIFAQWPIDSHRDHRALSAMVLDAWLNGDKHAAFYYYEVADDTMMFAPTQFVDISSVENRRRAACYAHASQLPDRWYPAQSALTRMRGQASGYVQAEGFVPHWQNRANLLP